MEIGPVLHLEDVIGSKMAAMITRAEPRDFVDIAAAMHRYTQPELMDLALRTDPSLTQDDVVECIQRLDRLDDSVFIRLYGLDSASVAEIRALFADWPRTL